MGKLNHKGTHILETRRLILRPFSVSDSSDMFSNWASDDEVTRFLTWPTHTDVSQTQSLLSVWEKSYGDDSVYHWAVVLKESNEVVGDISVVHMDEDVSCLELGWCLSRRLWGQGIMPEAASSVCRYLFEEVGVNRIQAKHDSNNPKSGRVMQKIGMKREGVLRQSGRNNTGLCDLVYWGILSSEF